MIGETISHYKVLEELGRGGMGIVYKAEDSKLKRLVALKFLPHHLNESKEERTRFLQEAQMAATLNHPNICTIMDVQEYEGREFIVMELLEGRNLRSVISEGPTATAQAINIALQVAEGLQAAHRKGIVHRDIKPENVVLTGDGIAKIADFGLARPDFQHLDSTGTGQISGTIAYMSPEQFQGEQVSYLTDIWSLGVVLYEMITGHRPFDSEYEQAAMYAITHEKHTAASALRPDVPGSLEKIIDRCLEKVPTHRFPDAASLGEALFRAREELKKPPAAEAKSIAILPFRDLSAEKDSKYFSDGLTEEIIAKLSKLRSIRVLSRTSVMKYEGGEKPAKQIASELGVQYVLEGSIRKQGTDLRIITQLVDVSQDVYLWAHKYDGTMEKIFKIQENVAAGVARALRMRLTPDEKRSLKRHPTDNTEAYQLYLRGRFFWNKRNRDGLHTAIHYFEEAIGKDPRYALAWAGIADSYNLLGEYGGISRKEIYSKARAAVKKALELDDQLAEAHSSLAGLIMLDELDWSGSEREFKRAMSLNPNYATAHHWYGEWLMYNGRMGEAIHEISHAVDLDPLSPAILRDKGVVLYYAREYDGAIECGEKTLEMDPSFASAHRLLSLGYSGKRMFEDAIGENRKWGEMTGNKVEASLGLAYCHAAFGRREEAMESVKRIQSEKSLTGNMMRGVALVHAALAENDQAFTWLEKAYENASESMCSVKVDPKLDHLRADPRFASFLKKLGLGQ